MFRTPYSDNALALGTALRLSLYVVPRKSLLLEAIDTAITEAKVDRRHADTTEGWNDYCEVLAKLYEARKIAGGRS